LSWFQAAQRSPKDLLHEHPDTSDYRTHRRTARGRWLLWPRALGLVTKLHILAPPVAGDPLAGILKYYAAGAMLGLLIVGSFAFMTIAFLH
jgi:hypothetical protein